MNITCRALFCLAFFLHSTLLEAQDSALLSSLDALNNAEELEKLFEDAAVNNNSQNSSNYENFSQSNISNVARQIKSVDSIPSETEYSKVLREKRIELAVELCSSDPQACFLLENYADYKDDKEPKSFEELTLYGTKIFSGYPLSFNQVDAISLPSNYQIKNGDKLSIQYFGTKDSKQTITVNNTGSIVIPLVGELFVSGNTIDKVQELLNDSLNNLAIGVSAIAKLESVYSQQIYAVGDIRFPGMYNLNASSKVVNAIIASGGFTKTSSLRNIKLLRNNDVIHTFDLYDFLIFGKTDNDIELMNADSILVQSATNIVSVLGGVNRPGNYEFITGENLEDLLQFTLGFKSRANKNLISVYRIQADGRYKSIILPNNFSDLLLEPGDRIFIPETKGYVRNFVKLTGAIRNQGEKPYKSNMVLSDIIDLETDIIENTYKGVFIVKRIDNPSNSTIFLYGDFSQIDRFKLDLGDEIFFLSFEDINFLNSSILREHLNSDKFKQLAKNAAANDNSVDVDKQYESLQCLRDVHSFGGTVFLQSALSKMKFVSSKENIPCPDMLKQNPILTPILLNLSVPVSGQVPNPGIYPISRSLNASILLSLSGNVIPSSFSSYIAEIGFYESEKIINSQLINLNNYSDVKFLNINKDKYEGEVGFVELIGEFKIPGKYPINKFTTLLDIYERSGGLTKDAFSEGGILTRESIRLREQRALDNAKIEMTEILSSAISSGVIKQSSSEALNIINLLSEMQNSKAIGRIITEFDPQVLFDDRSLNIFLKPGDKIYMPSITNTVTVVGNVLNPITVPFIPGKSIDYYISIAGGARKNADKSNAYAILPNGKILRSNAVYSLFSHEALSPGSSIIVPSKARPLSGLSLVEAVSPILANLSITAASLNSITSN